MTGYRNHGEEIDAVLGAWQGPSEHSVRVPEEDDRPVHRPLAPDAPIPGVRHYASCDPDHPRVGADGVCEGCGGRACPVCGLEVCSGHDDIVHADPVRICEMSECQAVATVYGGYAGAGDWAGWLCSAHASAPGVQVWDRL